MGETTYILTAEMDSDSFAWLDGLRRQHFPPARNVLSAHLTMFHRLSPAHVERLASIKLPDAPISVNFDVPIFLGGGVAIQARSAELARLRDEIKNAIGGDLSRQDGQNWRPHVTVQNKVASDAAKSLFRQLAGDFAEHCGTVGAVLVWEYLGGPWKLAQRLPFQPG